jgi:predicted adenine nucleotide alpha hydrolase (AANH) superfamily ATPase
VARVGLHLHKISVVISGSHLTSPLAFSLSKDIHRIIPLGLTQDSSQNVEYILDEWLEQQLNEVFEVEIDAKPGAKLMQN